MKLIQTEKYLLLIDEEAEIKENDTIYSVLYGIGKIIKDYSGESTKTYRPLIAKFQNSNVQQEYGRDGIWQLDVDGATVAKNNCKKVIAYYPLTKEAKELNLPLLPNPFEKEIDETTFFKNLGHECFVKMKELNPSGGIKEFIRIAVEFGYKAAQSKQFSLENMNRVAIEVANKVSRPEYGEIININEIVDTYIQSLSTQQLPKEFIPKYVYQTREEEWKEVLLPSEWFGTDEGDNPKRLKTITNSEGKEEIKGAYQY